jgi:hypothetical protein
MVNDMISKILIKENRLTFKNTPKIKQHVRTMQLNFRAFDIALPITNERQYFEALIMHEGLINKQALEQAFEDARRDLYDMWETLSFQERNRLIALKSMDVKNSLRHVVLNDEVIFIPFFDRLLNALYHKELAILELPQYFKLYKQFKDRVEPIHTYGFNLFDEKLIPIKNVLVKSNVRVFYYHPFKSLYTIDEDFNLTRYALSKALCQAQPLSSDLKTLAKALLHEDELDRVEALLLSPLIGNQTKKRLQKYHKSLTKKRNSRKGSSDETQ